MNSTPRAWSKSATPCRGKLRRPGWKAACFRQLVRPKADCRVFVDDTARPTGRNSWRLPFCKTWCTKLPSRLARKGCGWSESTSTIRAGRAAADCEGGRDLPQLAGQEGRTVCQGRQGQPDAARPICSTRRAGFCGSTSSIPVPPARPCVEYSRGSGGAIIEMASTPRV